MQSINAFLRTIPRSLLKPFIYIAAVIFVSTAFIAAVYASPAPPGLAKVEIAICWMALWAQVIGLTAMLIIVLRRKKGGAPDDLEPQQSGPLNLRAHPFQNRELSEWINLVCAIMICFLPWILLTERSLSFCVLFPLVGLIGCLWFFVKKVE